MLSCCASSRSKRCAHPPCNCNLHPQCMPRWAQPWADSVLQNELERLMHTYSINDELIAEVTRLREENDRLKSAY